MINECIKKLKQELPDRLDKHWKNVRKGDFWAICLTGCVLPLCAEVILILILLTNLVLSATIVHVNTVSTTEIKSITTDSGWQSDAFHRDISPDLSNPDSLAEPVWADYRSTVLPMLISVVITLLGCLITTYIFLKGTLDRIVDQKPYAEDIINGYRTETIRRLHWLFGISMLLTACTAILYFAFWDKIDVFRWAGHGLWIVVVILIGALSWIFLDHCVNSEENLLEQAIHEEQITNKQMKAVVEYKRASVKELHALLNENSAKVARSEYGECASCENKDIHNLTVYLDLEKESPDCMPSQGCPFDRKSLIYHFSALEEWLMLLANTFEEYKTTSSYGTRLLQALNLGKNLSQITLKDSILSDLSSNSYSKKLVDRFEQIEDTLEEFGQEELFEIYGKLSKYRNILRFLYETKADKITATVSAGEMADVMQAYLALRASCYITYAKIISRIQVIQPMEKLENINLYNCRIENSSFRGASFQYALLARIKALNTNFDMAVFKNVSFWNADIRNCALSNCLFLNVEMEGAYFYDVDFNYSGFTDNSFRSASFCNARFSSNLLKKVRLENTDFSNSRMWEVTFEEPENNEITNCIFSDADIRQWVICPGTANEEYEQLLQQMKYHDDNTNEAEKRLTDWLYNMYQEMNRKWDEFRAKRFEENELKEIRKQGQEQLKQYYTYDLENQNIPGREIWKRLSVLSRIRFDNSVFSRARIRESCFYLISFEQGVFRDAQMEKAQWLFLDMQGCMMDRANLKESWLLSVNLFQSNLENVLLYKANLCMVNMADSNLIQLQASKSTMYGCYFNRSDCSNADLTKATVKYSCFNDAIMNQSELTRSEFRHVSLRMMVGIDWLSSYSEFSDCDFYGAVLKGANFNYTTFKDCCFDFATLERISATKTRFINCKFQQVNFRESCLIETEFDNCEYLHCEYFENARLINCRFAKNMAILERLLKNDRKVVVIYDH